MKLATLRSLLVGAILIVLGIYLYGRYTAFADRDRAVTACMQGHDSARDQCERAIDLRR
jgi:hypothetical protein